MSALIVVAPVIVMIVTVELFGHLNKRSADQVKIAEANAREAEAKATLANLRNR